MAMTGEQLVAAVKRRCFWPRGVDKAPLTDAEILSFANEEILADARPMVAQVKGDYDLVQKDYTPVAGQARYRLPSRMYDGPRSIVWVDTDGVEYPLDPVELADVPREQRIGSAPSVRECRYLFEGDYLLLHPAPGVATGSLRVKFVLQPSTLVKTTDVNVVLVATTSIYDTASGAGVIGWTAGQLAPDGVTCDVVSSGNAHARLVWDAVMSASVGDTSAYSWPFDPQIALGDYLCRAGYTPLVPLPDAALGYFVRRVAQVCLESSDDEPGAIRELRAAEKARAIALGVLKPRNRAAASTAVCRNSALRSTWYGRG